MIKITIKIITVKIIGIILIYLCLPVNIFDIDYSSNKILLKQS